MADVKISALGAIGSVAGEDLVAIVDDPSGTPASRKATITQLATFINASAVTGSSTTTFTNKTIDAEGTGNAISNIDVANLKSGVLDTDISSVSGSDDTIPSAKAVKTYVDAQIATEDTLSELNDTTITSVGDNEILQYNNSSSVWENQTLAEAGISPVAGSSSIVTTGTIATGTWQGTAIAQAYIAGDAINGDKIADDSIDSEHYVDGSIDIAHISTGAKTECLAMAVSDNTTALATGTVFTFYMPYAMTLTDIKASVLTAPTGAGLIVDVHEAGTTIMSTDKLDIDVSEFHTSTAGTQPALTDTALANNAKIEIIVDQIGSTVAGAGLVIYLIGYQT